MRSPFLVGLEWFRLQWVVECLGIFHSAQDDAPVRWIAMNFYALAKLRRYARILVIRALLLSVLPGASALAAAAQAARLAFDVASLRENKAGVGPGGVEPDSNVPLGPGNVYSPTGGQMNLRNMPLLQMISFAYRMDDNQRNAFNGSAPEWARDARYDLQARTEKTDVTKDELRVMMQSLLADRFHMRVHTEQQMKSVYRMQFVKANSPGPHLRAHTGSECSKDFKAAPDTASGPMVAADGYPVVCGGLLLLSGSPTTHFRIGARDMPIAVFVTSMPSWGDLGRPVVNDTGMQSNIDFVLDFVTLQGEAAGTVDGDGFRVAMRKQLGITLEPDKRTVPVLVLDAISKPTEN